MITISVYSFTRDWFSTSINLCKISDLLFCDVINTFVIVTNNNNHVIFLEYAQNLKDTGVNGALLSLEPGFTSDDLATALGIPPSKSILRRHLATEFDALIQPAR